jgi:thiamine pyrophosphate-dependent acetolactate synthase large subunit-like protein
VIEGYHAIAKILKRIRADDLISRKVFMSNDQPRNFYMLGSMVLLSSFGLGLALLQPERRIWVLEGDGSALMSLGSLPLIAVESPANLVHIILDNEAYESTGGQPSISSKVKLAEVGKSCGCPHVLQADDRKSLGDALAGCEANPGPDLILVKVAIAPVKGIPGSPTLPTRL